MNILIDSCVFISFYDTDDSNHLKAIKDIDLVFNQENVLWVTEHIVDEICTIFIKRNHRKSLNDFIDLLDQKDVLVFSPKNMIDSETMRMKTINYLLKQKKVKASFTDIYSFVVAQEGFLPNCRVLSYDHHLVTT